MAEQQTRIRLSGLSWLKFNRALFAYLLILLLLFVWVPRTGAAPVSQTNEPTPTQIAALALLNQMSIEERVGQLFLVTFQGDTATNESDIADLIINYRVGGVVLTAENDNLTGHDSMANIPNQVAALTNDLQSLSLFGTVTVSQDPIIEEGAVPPNRDINAPQTPIPLLIAIAHEGDGYPNSEIMNGLTAVPNNMTMGATWDPDNARTVGEVVGRELTAIGINFLMGPSLDVLEQPAAGSNDLGVRSFGGDPYWVGLMAQAYTGGVHAGSHNRIAVVPKHFPGYGSSDRSLHEEVPTVRKSLEQLKQIELAPFFTVTDNAIGDPETADALLTTHIRYQGFQGNIRATTNPVSFDQQALSTLMAQGEFTGWRQDGGILVSDALGVRAVKRFYDDTGQTFPHRLVAKDAFLAGNDLLYLADFALGEGNYETELANTKDTIDWFRERYRTDPAFQVQVDTAVLRILQLKLRLYSESFSSANVFVNLENVTSIVGQESTAMFEIAQNAVTLIFPTISDLAERLPQAPKRGENMVIFTDVRTAQQCSICPPQPLIGENAIADRILALYGPAASNQVQPQQITSFSYADLQAFLDAGPGPIILPTPVITSTNDLEITASPESTATPSPTPEPPPGYQVQEALRNVQWIIFGMLDAADGSQALTNFLKERPDLVRNANVIVFAYNAPYYLDSTEISQLSAFIGVYSKSTEYIDTSVRALFQELPYVGAPPVDVSGVRYELFTQTRPKPDQIIELFVVDEDEVSLTENDEPLNVSVGDTLNLRTGIVRDFNGNPVPDGTLVRFIQQDRVDGLVTIIAEIPTQNGIAQLNYVLESRTEAGQFRITAESGDARISIEVNISVGVTEGAAQISLSTPVPTPTSTPTTIPTETATATPTETATPPPTETAVPIIEPEAAEPAVLITIPEFQMLFAFLAGLGIVGTASLLVSQRSFPNLHNKIGVLLWSIVGALFLYNYFALGLPGANLLQRIGSWAGLLTTVSGGILGMFIYQFRHSGMVQKQ